jgi:CMP-N-acetylneuraminic acid synthetase
MKKKILCVVLAKKNSKGLPNKNMKLLLGKPLIWYTFDAIKKSKIFDRVILSSDSIKIINFARKMNIEAPFVRPKKYSSHRSSALDALRHSLDWILKNDQRYDYVQYIFPTNPLIKSSDIKNGLKNIIKFKSDMVISVCKSREFKNNLNFLKKGGSLKNFIPKKFRFLNRQSYPLSYKIDGCIYIAKWDVWYFKKDWFSIKTKAIIRSAYRSIDINDKLDFEIAKILLKKKYK